MIICVLNNTKKIWIISVKARSFIDLNDPYVLNGLYIEQQITNDNQPNQAFH